ncbi:MULTISPECIES: hypothetical protein [unclassified Variovorax]|uniref:hypothetical protein n=1 Tax=unclassified Variovorax TaxID=663243 RepID=UPI00083872A5|nr:MULTISPECIES: hypothetical protein [unclassified Variovorax]PNG48954.1 hypothetical protein CHC07_06596 [Variovorax sp. B4]PNG49768.1 hypothetical protein CHC06_05349 [Variovorax sp. B2]VTV18519.1 hypothetical protein WDL1P2_00217 [Variovorax sp. WDL1]
MIHITNTAKTMAAMTQVMRMVLASSNGIQRPPRYMIASEGAGIRPRLHFASPVLAASAAAVKPREAARSAPTFNSYAAMHH